jgi:hypothetical protein
MVVLYFIGCEIQRWMDYAWKFEGLFMRIWVAQCMRIDLFKLKRVVIFKVR